MKFARILAALPLLVALARAQDPERPPVVDVTAANLERHLKYLAGDDLEGRNSGYKGNDAATDYIAEHFRKIGLKPVGDKDEKGEPTYWQSFKVLARKTRNCVGYAEGTDEKLKTELVVIGAHHDHVGKAGQADAGRMKNSKADPEDKIWNGADDNGSGTVTVLEIARAFMEGRVSTKRSILFMTFSGEEYGLLGSEHYCKKPIFPLKSTVAMINLDMVGRNPDKRLDVGGISTSEDWQKLIDAAAEGTGVKYGTSREVTPGSDHYSFYQVRVPAIHFFTGFHGDYHCQSDHPDKISYANMEKIGRFGMRLLRSVADEPQRIKPSFKAASKKLGIGTSDLTEDDYDALKLGDGEGGLQITSVADESPARAGGLQKGDVIVEFDGQKLPRKGTLEKLRELIGKSVDGVDVPIVVLREGGRAELKVRWEKSE